MFLCSISIKTCIFVFINNHTRWFLIDTFFFKFCAPFRSAKNFRFLLIYYVVDRLKASAQLTTSQLLVPGYGSVVTWTTSPTTCSSQQSTPRMARWTKYRTRRLENGALCLPLPGRTRLPVSSGASLVTITTVSFSLLRTVFCAMWVLYCNFHKSAELSSSWSQLDLCFR